MQRIRLTRGKFALVDDIDFDSINQHKWYFDGRYATRVLSRKLNNGKQKRVFMHREILNPPSNLLSDHINGDMLDNRRCNLRTATATQNSCNRRISKRNKSGFPGVNYQPHYKYKKWGVYIKLPDKQKYIGGFQNFQDAIIARKKAMKEHFGKFVRI